MGVCPRSFGRTPLETIGDSKTEFNRILCTSKSETAVTSNKKLRCRYVEADYRQARSIVQPLCDSWASCLLWKDDRLSWPGWLPCSRQFTHISGHPSAGQAKFAGQRPTFYHCATQQTYNTLCHGNGLACLWTSPYWLMQKWTCPHGQHAGL